MRSLYYKKSRLKVTKIGLVKNLDSIHEVQCSNFIVYIVKKIKLR